MKLILILVLAIGLSSISQYTFAQQFRSAQQYGTSTFDYSYKIAAGPNGSYYLAGSAPGDTTLGMQEGVGQTGMFVIKFDSADNIIWAQRSYIGSGGIRNLVVDTEGNVYAAGYLYSAHMTFSLTPNTQGPGAIHFTRFGDNSAAFLVKFNANGAGVWSHSFQGDITISDLAVTRQGNLFLAGSFSGNATIGNTNLVSLGHLDEYGAPKHADILLAGLAASNGAIHWAKRAGAPYKLDYSAGIGTDLNGNVYLAGTVEGNVTIDNQSIGNVNSPRILLTKCNPAGAVLWAKLLGESYQPRAQHLRVDSLGNSYLVGNFGPYVNFNNSPILFEGMAYHPFSNANSSEFLAKLTPSGVGEWIRPIGHYVRDICLDGNLNIYTLGTVRMVEGQQYAYYPDFPVEPTGNANICVAKLDNYGFPEWARAVGGGGNQMPKSISAADNGGVLISGDFHGTLNIDGNILESRGWEDIFVARIKVGPVTTVTGKVFIDTNANGTWDTGEQPAVNVIVALNPDKGSSNSRYNGHFVIHTAPGTYSAKIPHIPYYYSLSTLPPAVTLNSFGDTEALAPMGLVPVPGIPNVEATFTALTAFRPGFTTPCRITYTNTGTSLASSAIRLEHDPALVFLNCAPASTTSSSNVLEWEFQNLAPGEERHILLKFNLPATVDIGTVLHTNLFASFHLGYENPLYHHYPYEHVVTGSYDPNDKAVEPNGPISPRRVSEGKPLTYTIRFQNTGTDTAFTVVVKDYLSPLLDPASIRILDASHPYTFSYKTGGIAEWRFDNILLPDSGRNYQASNGFVKFEVKPKSTLKVGDLIENKAFIYFDYNEPIITNTTQTAIKAAEPIAAPENPFTLYPNPNDGVFQLKANLPTNTSVQLTCYNSTGQIIFTETRLFTQGVSRQLFEMANQPEGLYFLQIRLPEDQVFYSKFVRQGP